MQRYTFYVEYKPEIFFFRKSIEAQFCAMLVYVSQLLYNFHLYIILIYYAQYLNKHAFVAFVQKHAKRESCLWHRIVTK